MTLITDIYSEALATLPMDEMDYHASDLYLKATPAAIALIERYQWKQNVTRFNSAIDGSVWLDVPFAYSPAWGSDLPPIVTRSQTLEKILKEND